jgi:integrase
MKSHYSACGCGCGKHGLTMGIKSIRPQFRRTVATLMDQDGLGAKAVADQLGDSRPSLTQDVYYGRRIASTGAAEVLEVLG